MKNILIIGATSGMAEAVARSYAAEGCAFFLIGRSQEKLQVIATDLLARRAAAVHTAIWEATDHEALTAVLDGAWAQMGVVDLALVAHGSLPDQARAEADITYAMTHFSINGASAVASLLWLANKFEAQGHGAIVVIGSVAGDRGRPSNYLYGSAKAAVESCASGIRARLYKRGVHVLLVKPGFVSTAMTAHLNLPPLLTASADQVAIDIRHAIDKKRDVLYTRWFWRWIMLIIQAIPNFIFKRLSL